jgi:type 1 fimbria pilin
MNISTQLRNGLLLTMLATACSGAFAAESADLSVKGVIRPSACSIALSNNGTVDYGTISAKSLSATAVNKLPDRDVTMTINCDAATKVGFRVEDNRAGTESDIVKIVDPAARWVLPLGLGAVDGKNLGGYAMKVLPADATGDGAAVGGLSYAYGAHGEAWQSASDFENYVRVSAEYAWSDTDGGTPNSYKTISQVLRIVGALNSTADLPSLTSNVELDGSATISVVYL